MEKIYNKYQNTVLEDAGSYNSKEFINFANYMKRRMKAQADKREIALANFSIGHYDISGFFEKNGKYVYFSYSEPRRLKIDLTRSDPIFGFLVRKANGPRDFHGGYNSFTDIFGFMERVEQLIK